MVDIWRASFDTGGSGSWEVALPADCSWHDLEALAPVIDEIRQFVGPTVDDGIGHAA